MVQSRESVIANLDTWICPHNNVSQPVLSLMADYLISLKLVSESDEVVPTYESVATVAIKNIDYPLDEEVSFYDDMYDHMKFVYDRMKGGD